MIMKKILMLSVLFVSISSSEGVCTYQRQYINRYRPGNLYRDLQSSGLRNPYTIFSPLQGLFSFYKFYNMQEELLSQLKRKAFLEAYEQTKDEDAEIVNLDRSELMHGRDKKTTRLRRKYFAVSNASRALKDMQDMSGRDILIRVLSEGSEGNVINEDTLPETHKDAKRIQNFSKNISRDLEKLREDAIDFAQSVYQ